MLRYLYSHSGHPGNVKLGHSHSVLPRQARCVEGTQTNNYLTYKVRDTGAHFLECPSRCPNAAAYLLSWQILQHQSKRLLRSFITYENVQSYRTYTPVLPKSSITKTLSCFLARYKTQKKKKKKGQRCLRDKLFHVLSIIYCFKLHPGLSTTVFYFFKKGNLPF